MATVTDYPSLVQAMQDFSHRADIAAFMKYFVQFGELKIYRDIFALNLGNGIRWLEQPFSATINATTGFVPIPTGYLALDNLQITDGNGDQFTLLYEDTQYIYSTYPVRQPTGLPAYVARDGTNFIFGPFPDAAYGVTGTYYGFSTPIGPNNPRTWMTANCPEVLFAACMAEVQPFLRSQGDLTNWEGIYGTRLGGFVDIDKSERYAPGAMAMEIG